MNPIPNFTSFRSHSADASPGEQDVDTPSNANDPGKTVEMEHTEAGLPHPFNLMRTHQHVMIKGFLPSHHPYLLGLVNKKAYQVMNGEARALGIAGRIKQVAKEQPKPKFGLAIENDQFTTFMAEIQELPSYARDTALIALVTHFDDMTVEQFQAVVNAVEQLPEERRIDLLLALKEQLPNDRTHERRRVKFLSLISAGRNLTERLAMKLFNQLLSSFCFLQGSSLTRVFDEMLAVAMDFVGKGNAQLVLALAKTLAAGLSEYMECFNILVDLSQKLEPQYRADLLSILASHDEDFFHEQPYLEACDRLLKASAELPSELRKMVLMAMAGNTYSGIHPPAVSLMCKALASWPIERTEVLSKLIFTCAEYRPINLNIVQKFADTELSGDERQTVLDEVKTYTDQYKLAPRYDSGTSLLRRAHHQR